jgi:hypothetical protein
MDPFAIAVIVLGILLFFTLLTLRGTGSTIAELYGKLGEQPPESAFEAVNFYVSTLFSTTLPSLLGKLVDYLPVFIFWAGPIIDVINQTYMYTKASITGALGVLLLALVGSCKFETAGKGFYNLLFPVNTTPGSVTFGKPSFGWSTILGLLGTALLITGLAFVPSFFGSGQGQNSVLGWQIGGGIAGGLVLLVLGLYLVGSGTLKVSSTASVTGCEVPGFAWYSDDLKGPPFYNGIVPSNMVLTMTILLCHLIQQIDTQSTSLSLAVSTGIVFFLQWINFYSKGCSSGFTFGSWSPIVALLLSTIFAGVMYGALKSMNETFVGSTVSESFSQGVFHPSTTTSSGVSNVGSNPEEAVFVGPQPSEKEMEAQEDEQFIGELFKDGEPITSVILAQS